MKYVYTVSHFTSVVFDTVWYEGLWLRLWEAGVRGKAWRVVRGLYDGVEASVRVGDKETRRVRLRQGVRQGCPLSPVLFNAFVDGLSKELADLGVGIKKGDRFLHSLLYADDLVLLAESAENLQTAIDKVDEYCEKWHLRVNLKKSKVMVIGGGVEDECASESDVGGEEEEEEVREGVEGARSRFLTRGRRIEVVQEYKYLGVWFSKDLTWTRHFEHVKEMVLEKMVDLGRFFPSTPFLWQPSWRSGEQSSDRRYCTVPRWWSTRAERRPSGKVYKSRRGSRF
jgi:hypothetical protein